MSTLAERISIEKAELEDLKRQLKQEKIAARIQNKWVNAEKRLPEVEGIRVIAWANDRMEPCWYAGEKWYVYDGSFFLLEKDRIENVTHWMPKDFLYTKDWPLYGPGIKNWLRYYWQRFTQGASDMAQDMRPKGWSSKAQLDKKVVYYKNECTGEIRMGAPESFPVTPGFQKIVCTSAHEAEVWSDRLRKYNHGKEAKIDDQREMIEGAAAKEIRSEIHHRMANSTSKYGRVYMERFLERMDKAEGRRKMTREEYLHSEGHESRR